MSGSVAPAGGIIGVFFVMLGAGLILDADWIWRGASAIAIGGYLVVAACRPAGGAR